MSRRSGWMEYPDGMDQRVKGLEDFLRVVYFKHLNQTGRNHQQLRVVLCDHQKQAGPPFNCRASFRGHVQRD